NEFRASCSTRWTGTQFRPELMLVFRLRKIAEHIRRRSEKDEAPAFVEQDRFVKHLKKFRARLVNRDNDDFVMREASNDFHDVLGIFFGKGGSWCVETI